jgi:predicted TPR repeat methyltransferase
MYDALAGQYDAHFTRPVDRWEDARLARLLAPLVTGRAVLDLGCGTGWLLDHTDPAAYTGVDCSAPMLATLAAKHPGVSVAKARVGADGWRDELPDHGYDVITATWALQYFGSLAALLPALAALARPGGVIALHGYLPRGFRRSHVITPEPTPCHHPGQVRIDSRSAGLPRPSCHGTGALPDQLARSRLAWSVAADLAPARLHYAALWTWRLP